MKRCPLCQQTYSEETLQFCRMDGTALEFSDAATTAILTKSFAPSPQAKSIETNVLTEPAPKPNPGERITSDLKPETRYARSGDINIAYQVMGNGPIDLVYVPGWVTHLEYGW